MASLLFRDPIRMIVMIPFLLNFLLVSLLHAGGRHAVNQR
jgi:hypothetical protein